MNCSEVRELLSAYYDGELNEDDCASVSEHLQECAPCEAELAGFQQLSVLAGDLASPAPPDNGWKQLEQQLGSQAEVVVTAPTPQNSRKNYHLVALAVSVLAVIGISSLAYLTRSQPDKETQFSREFNQYLEEFQSKPDAAQEYLLANYKHWKVDPSGDIDQIKYRPAVADGLPDDYAIEVSYVFKMPCCTCVQSLCRRKDGPKIAIFEHDNEENDHWFGDRPRIDAVCNGKKCCLVELGDRLAVTWKHENRYISLIGVRDISEVNEFIGWMDDRRGQ